MKATHIAALFICVGMFSQVASAQQLRWNNVPSPVYTQPPVVFVQPNAIDLSGLANALNQYENRRSSANNNNSDSSTNDVFGRAVQSQYEEMSTFRADLQACFNKGLVSSNFFSASDQAVDITLELFTFNRNVLNNMTDNAFEKSVATPEMCRETEARGYKLQAIAFRTRGKSQ